MSTNLRRITAPGLFALFGALVLAGCSSDDDPANRAPVANAGLAQSVKVNTPVTIDGSKSSDPDGNTLTFKWAFKSQPDGSALKIDATTNKVAVTPTIAGEYEVELTVSDGALTAKATAKITVTAAGTNGKPVAKLGPNGKVLINTEVKLDGTQSTDPETDSLTYKWTLKTKPANSTSRLSDAAVPKPTFTPDLAGDYVVSLVVHDGKVDSDAVEVKITAKATNSKPLAKTGAAQAQVAVQTDLEIDGSQSSDEDTGDTLSYLWSISDKPSGSNPTLTGDTAKVKFKADKAGTYKVQLIVDDGIAKSDPVTVTITVTN